MSDNQKTDESQTNEQRLTRARMLAVGLVCIAYSGWVLVSHLPAHTLEAAMKRFGVESVADLWNVIATVADPPFVYSSTAYYVLALAALVSICVGISSIACAAFNARGGAVVRGIILVFCFLPMVGMTMAVETGFFRDVQHAAQEAEERRDAREQRNDEPELETGRSPREPTSIEERLEIAARDFAYIPFAVESMPRRVRIIVDGGSHTGKGYTVHVVDSENLERIKDDERHQFYTDLSGTAEPHFDKDARLAPGRYAVVIINSENIMNTMQVRAIVTVE